ncbi:MAG: HAD family hydrolase [Thermoprotei archaeon]
MTSVKLVSFDIWNTLLDLHKFYNILARMLSKITGKSYSEIGGKIINAYREALDARLRGVFKRPVYDSALFFSEKLGISVDVLFRATVLAVLDTEIAQIAFPDASETLRELRGRGYRIAFLGNVMFWPGMVTRLMLEKNGLLEYADITLFGDEIGVQKPDKRVFEYLAELCDCGINEILHVGDSLVNDFAGALLAGASAALIKRDLGTDIVKLSDKAYIINSLKTLLELLA